MHQKQHWAIFIDNRSDKNGLISRLLSNDLPENFKALYTLRGALFSKGALNHFIEEEAIHDQKLLNPDTSQSLQSMSSGERKKALLEYLLQGQPDFLILDNPFDNLDRDSQKKIKAQLKDLSQSISVIQIASRKEDLLPFINTYGRLLGSELLFSESLAALPNSNDSLNFQRPLPAAPENNAYEWPYLIRLKSVSVSYGSKGILNNINWDVKPGDFWELSGPNGSGKTTILSMITGDNPKAFGQDLELFGYKKGSGESVWDIKQNIGYFTPAMIDRFRGYHSLENMLISGLLDSIGLYIKPTEAHLRIAQDWLGLLGMEKLKNTYFHELSDGQRRLIMCARAMVKHPPLLILDEPTAGLDDASAALVVALVNKIAAESKTAVIYVSHRKEPGLKAPLLYELQPSSTGSTGRAKTQ